MELAELPSDDVDRDIDRAPGDLPRHLSPSSASAYEQCPRRWAFRYIERLPDPPGEAALAGTFAHRVLEVLLGEPDAGRTLERAKVLARDLWPEVEDDADYQALRLDDAGARAFRWRGWRAIEGLWSLEDPCEVAVRSTEQNVETEIGGVPFRGIIDRLDEGPGGLTVTDYKSGRAPSNRFSADRLSQVLLYAAAVAEATGERPVRARLLYLGQKIVETDVTDDGLRSVTDQLRATWDALCDDCETQTFASRPGPLCAWCPYVAHCDPGIDEVRRRRDLGSVRPDAPALRLVPT